MLAAVGPLGCMPNQIARGIGPHEKCLELDNDMVRLFNERLLSLVNRLNALHRPGTIFVYGNSYDGFINILNNANNYGMDRTSLPIFYFIFIFFKKNMTLVNMGRFECGG